ncbi:MFS transporter [Neptunicella sp. SCSIO 80796]|uniref:MFS transporter n=1 Tax=Neptunicella plasticusilytica TaxID=3117012 RepID=UPI003A4D5C3F
MSPFGRPKSLSSDVTDYSMLNQRLILGCGFFSLFFASQGVTILAIPFYQMTLGIDPFLLALAMTIPALLGNVPAPWVGHFSDNLRSRFGRRRPVIFVAAILSGLTFGMIWMVSPQWSASAQLGYFVLFSTLFYLSTTLLTVPMTSLSYELSQQYHQRTETMGIVTYFIKLGSVLYQWLFPLAQLSLFASVFIGIQYVGWGVGLFIIGLMGLIPALFIRERRYVPGVTQAVSLRDSLITVIRYKPLLIVILLCFLQLAGGGFTASMDYYLLVYYLFDGDIAQGAIWKGILSTAYAVTGFVTVPLVTRLSARLGKVSAMAVLYWLTAIGGVLKWFLFTPGAPWLIIFDAFFCTAIWTSMTVIIPSMLADLCDEDERHNGVRREGMFAAIHSWIIHLSVAGALLLSGLSLNVIDFNANLQNQQSAESILSMRIILSVGTVIFSLLPLIFLRYYKIDEQRSNQTHRLLMKRAEISLQRPTKGNQN